METKCGVCQGEGLVHQGESISKLCGSCAGTGKSVSSEVSASEEVGVPPESSGEAPAVAESFSPESGVVGEVPEGSVEAPV